MTESPLFPEDAPDRFDPDRPARRAGTFEALRRYFRHEIRGLENLPRQGPALLVLNHGPVAMDALLLAWVILQETGRWPRFLAERFVFENAALTRFLAPWGVVEGNHYQARRRFEAGDLVAVFPGGAREAWKPRREAATVRWQGRDGFARLAFKAGVPIIPVACPAADRMYYVPFDGWALGQRLFGGRISQPVPLAMGLGLLPLPVKLIHHVGAPVRVERRPGETGDEAAGRLKAMTEAAMVDLLRRG